MPCLRPFGVVEGKKRDPSPHSTDSMFEKGFWQIAQSPPTNCFVPEQRGLQNYFLLSTKAFKRFNVSFFVKGFIKVPIAL
jgi:hypothetical protein